jgi:hypothetical protein
MASSIDQLTQTMIDYTRRLAALEAQAVFVNALREHAARFPQQTEEVGAAAADPVRPGA